MKSNSTEYRTRIDCWAVMSSPALSVQPSRSEGRFSFLNYRFPTRQSGITSSGIQDVGGILIKRRSLPSPASLVTLAQSAVSTPAIRDHSSTVVGSTNTTALGTGTAGGTCASIPRPGYSNRHEPAPDSDTGPFLYLFSCITNPACLFLLTSTAKLSSNSSSLAFLAPASYSEVQLRCCTSP